MYIDSHCHIDFDDFQDRLPDVLSRMAEHDVTHALCVSVTLDAFPGILRIAEAHPSVFASVGVHPDYPDAGVVSPESLVDLARAPKVVAIGETGLDYYRLSGDLEWQRDRFRAHIRAARIAALPLIIHTRSAAEDTIRLMREEGADAAGGVMHCFTESWEVAEAALDLGFYISFSGIVTFKSAADLRDVARRVPLDRLLIETDSPYLAPVPFRGKINEPAFVPHVARQIAELKGLSPQRIGAVTSDNFFNLFTKASALRFTA